MRQVVIPHTLAHPPVRPLGQDCHLLAGESMGTTWQVRMHARASELPDLRAAIERTLALVIRQMSHWNDESDLSRFNSAVAGSWVALPELLFDLLEKAQQMSALTGGAFDATTGGLVRRWGFGPDSTRLRPDFALPDVAVLHVLREQCGWRRMELARDPLRARQPGGLELDLSAIAKGFAVDLVSMQLNAAGVDSHLVEIGGELRGAGIKADAQPWWVALEMPADDVQCDATVVALCDRAIATSGDYRRCFEHAGRRIAHTLDPRNGQPVHNDLASVTVISDACWQADALSTALMVLGPEEGLRFADQHGVAARLVRRLHSGFRECRSQAWSDMLL